MAHLRRTLMLSLFVALAACGGGSSGSVFGVGLFAGFYDATTTGFQFGANAEAEVSLVNVDGAGAGNVTDGIDNDDGTIAASTPGPFNYTIDGEGNVGITTPAFPTLVADGGISADGKCVLIGATGFNSDPSFIALLRHGSGFTNASLTGSYHFGYFFCGLTAIGAGWGMGTFDGAGGWAVDTFQENDNTNLSSGGSIPGQTYNVAASGRVTASFTAFDLRGMLCNEGDFGILGGDVAPLPGTGAGPMFFVLVRKGTGMSNAALSGSYWTVGGGYTIGGVTNSFFGTANADGAGGVTSDVMSNDDGTVNDPPVDNATYTVGADGMLTLTINGNTLIGGVTADGRFGFAAGGTTDPSDVQFVLFCRKN